MSCVSRFGSSLFVKFPIILDVLRYVGAAYILYLSYKMFGSLNIKNSTESAKPLTYFEAIIFQFVNPKAWVICTTAVSSFYLNKKIFLLELYLWFLCQQL